MPPMEPISDLRLLNELAHMQHRDVKTVVVSRSTIPAGPINSAPGRSSARSWIRDSSISPCSGSKKARERTAEGYWPTNVSARVSGAGRRSCMFADRVTI